jgi:hypothetical protein
MKDRFLVLYENADHSSFTSLVAAHATYDNAVAHVKAYGVPGRKYFVAEIRAAMTPRCTFILDKYEGSKS